MIDYAKKMNITRHQFEELRERLFFTYSREDLEDIGADVSEWTAEEWEAWDASDFGGEDIADLMVFKAFGGYAFVDDDFWGGDET